MERGEDRPERSEDGVDLTLIRWMLSLTPGERLAVLQDRVDSKAYPSKEFVYWLCSNEKHRFQ